ncbi:hypothetical protein [Methylobacterium pseudosasicola]|uniref:hypothetical protein n=1 Tax=Methylobacterium pseudosasicola TaxID=582667 RepID=UPI001113BD0C|nr:hypothetical protein [Methylobacterium pseudosasicola]
MLALGETDAGLGHIDPVALHLGAGFRALGDDVADAVDADCTAGHRRARTDETMHATVAGELGFFLGVMGHGAGRLILDPDLPAHRLGRGFGRGAKTLLVCLQVAEVGPELCGGRFGMLER